MTARPRWHRWAQALGFALLIALVWVRPADQFAQQQVEAGLQRALTSFAAARGINALISLAESVQLGVGVSFQPGALLDPIDDLVEQFSAILLVATLSFAAQRLLIDIVGAWPLCAALSALIGVWALWHLRTGAAPRWLARVSVALLCLRLVVPASALASEAIYRGFMASGYEASQAQLQIAQTVEPEARPGEGLVERAKRWWAQGSDAAKQIDELKAKFDAAVAHMVRVAAIFLLQTVALPLFFFWLMTRLYRQLFAAQASPRE